MLMQASTFFMHIKPRTTVRVYTLKKHKMKAKQSFCLHIITKTVNITFVLT